MSANPITCSASTPRNCPPPVTNLPTQSSEEPDFYWSALNMRFATQAMGRFTFDNSHGDMGTVMLSLQGAPAGVVAEGQVYTIVESPAGNITGAFKNLPDGAILAALTTGQEFTINYTSHAITLTAAPIPEPSTYALLGGVGALALVLVSRWRRHRV